MGEGELESYLKRLINKLNLQDNILMLGHSKNVYKYLKSSDLYVFPSIFEGFPNALAEAICMGLPCIATDFKTGAREIIAPTLLGKKEKIVEAKECEYGMLTPLCSDKEYSYDVPLEHAEKELAKAIIQVLTDDELAQRLAEKSVRCSQNLDIEAAISKWIAVIEE